MVGVIVDENGVSKLTGWRREEHDECMGYMLESG